MPPGLPGSRTRAERFEADVRQAVDRVHRRLGKSLDAVEFGIEDLPPSSPAPWEAGSVPLGRYFPADSAAGLRHRVVLYRRPIEARAEDHLELRDLIREVVVEQVAHLLGRPPSDIDPGFRRDG